MDINYNELYGIETAETVEADNTDAGAEENAAGEQQTEQEATDTQAEETPESVAETPEKKTEQTPEERARQAEGRRRREWEERGAKAERDRNNALIARLGIKYPQGHEKAGQTISTVEELEEYDRDQSEQRLAQGSGTADDIRRVVKEEMARASERVKSAETQPPSEDPRIAAELEQIKAMDPDTKGDINVILSSPQGKAFRDYVNKGLSFLDAYTLAARDKLDAAKAQKAAEAARVQAASKDHLSATGTRGQGAVSVPSDEMALYRIFNPDASDEEIQKHYNTDRKKYGPK